MKTGVAVWKQETLSDTILKVIVVSVPTVKFRALNVCAELMEFSLLNKQASVLQVDVIKCLRR